MKRDIGYSFKEMQYKAASITGTLIHRKKFEASQAAGRDVGTPEVVRGLLKGTSDEIKDLQDREIVNYLLSDVQDDDSTQHPAALRGEIGRYIGDPGGEITRSNVSHFCNENSLPIKIRDEFFEALGI